MLLPSLGELWQSYEQWKTYHIERPDLSKLNMLCKILPNNGYMTANISLQRKTCLPSCTTKTLGNKPRRRTQIIYALQLKTL